EWSIRVQMRNQSKNSGTPGQIDCVFKHPTEVRVPPRVTVTIPFSFMPRKAGHVQSAISQQTTSDMSKAGAEKMTYSIREIAEDPLPEEPIVIECIARKEVRRKIKVPNINNLSAFGLGEDNQCQRKEKKRKKKELLKQKEILQQDWKEMEQKQMYGEFASMVFSSNTLGEYYYELYLTCDPTEHEQLDSMQCELGMCAIQVIQFESSLTVDLKLDCESSDPTVFSIGPYVPSLVDFGGEKIKMISREELAAINNASGIIGGTGAGGGMLRGDIQRNVIVELSIPIGSKGPQIKVLKGQWGRALVKYIPSRIDEYESTILKLASQNAGKWEFKAKGIGKRPTLMPSITLTAQVSESTSKPIVFCNPFAHTLLCDNNGDKLNASVNQQTPNLNQNPQGSNSNSPTGDRTQQSDQQGISQLDTLNNFNSLFSVLLRQQQKIQLDSRAELQVPIAFQPTSLITASARVVVRAYGDPAAQMNASSQTTGVAHFTEQNPLIWTQPVIGISEMYFPQIPVMDKEIGINDGEGKNQQGNNKDKNIKQSNNVVGAVGQTSSLMGQNQQESGNLDDGSITAREYITLAIQTQTGQAVDKVLQLPLIGLTATRKTIYNFINHCVNSGLVPLPQHFKKMLQQTTRTGQFIFVPENPVETEEQNKYINSINTIPIVSIPYSFHPTLSTPRTKTNLVLQRHQKAGGGRWRFTIWVTATMAPEIMGEDIVLSALVGKTAEQTFVLESLPHVGQVFQAAFCPGANSEEFVLKPRNGTFDDYGRVVITVRFSPTRYAGTRPVQLGLSAYNKIWLYTIRGELPIYEPPSGTSKIDSRWDKTKQGQK
ncbi:MAG: hypothetical protein EZS28_016520, partial [Streblomastix strix]